MSTPDETEAHDTSAGQSTAPRTDQPLPEVLGSPRAKLVYLYLRTVREGRVEDIQRALGMQALAVYPILETLIEHEFVERTGNGHVMITETHE